MENKKTWVIAISAGSIIASILLLFTYDKPQPEKMVSQSSTPMLTVEEEKDPNVLLSQYLYKIDGGELLPPEADTTIAYLLQNHQRASLLVNYLYSKQIGTCSDFPKTQQVIYQQIKQKQYHNIELLPENVKQAVFFRQKECAK